MLRPYKEEVLRSGNGASLSHCTGNFLAALIEGRIWYAALGGKHSPSKIAFICRVLLRAAGRGDDLSITDSVAKSATRSRHTTISGDSTDNCFARAGSASGNGGHSVCRARSA